MPSHWYLVYYLHVSTGCPPAGTRYITYMSPLDALPLILLLLLFENQLNEQLLKLLVAVVDTELLEAATETCVKLCLVCGAPARGPGAWSHRAGLVCRTPTRGQAPGHT